VTTDEERVPRSRGLDSGVRHCLVSRPPRGRFLLPIDIGLGLQCLGLGLGLVGWCLGKTPSCYLDKTQSESVHNK